MPSREQVMTGTASASVSWVKCSDSVTLGVVIRSSERTPLLQYRPREGHSP